MPYDPASVNPEYVARCEEFLTARGFDLGSLAHPGNEEGRMMAAVAINLASNLDPDQCDAVVAAICLRHPWAA